MHFDIPLQDYNFVIKLENCSIKIIGGNWGIFAQSFKNHLHSYYELHYVTGGQGTLVTDTIKMPLSKGCFYLLPPRTNHEQWSSQLDNLQEYHLSFELICSSEKDYVWKNLFLKGLYSTNQEEIEKIFGNIAKETIEKQYGYLDIIVHNLQEVFITLMRSITVQENNRKAPASNLDDKRSMMIDDAFIFGYNTITLVELSQQLKLSTRQTQRFIKDKYGVSFSTLKFKARLNHAAMLLSTTKLPVEEICLKVGYKNYSFFSKSFKQYYQMTPANYRKTHAIN